MRRLLVVLAVVIGVPAFVHYVEAAGLLPLVGGIATAAILALPVLLVAVLHRG